MTIKRLFIIGLTIGIISTGTVSYYWHHYSLNQLTQRVINHIHTHEKSHDATCWSTTRQMESFYAGMPLTKDAGITKIILSKQLLQQLWYHASQTTYLPIITTSHLSQQLSAYTMPSSNNDIEVSHYHRITENWRLILSLLQEQQLLSTKHLKPMTHTAFQTLATHSTAITIMLLKRAQAAAITTGHRQIQSEDILTAYHQISDQLKLPPIPNNLPKVTYTHSITHAPTLSHHGYHNMTQKFQSLTHWNQTQQTPSANHFISLFNNLYDISLSQDGFTAFQEALRTLAHSLIINVKPFRRDMWFGHHSRLQQFPHTVTENSFLDPAYITHYLSLEWAFDAVQSIIPLHQHANADISFHLQLPPHRSLPNFPETIHRRIPFYQLDAFRDTGFHWHILIDLWRTLSPHYGIDPFAAELITERLSEYGTFLLLEAHAFATKNDQAKITESAIIAIDRQPHIFALPPSPPSSSNVSLTQPYRPTFKKITTPFTTTSYIPTSNKAYTQFALVGSGVAIGDVNNDGLLDLFFAGEGGNQLYINHGNFQFRNETHQWGLDIPDYRHTKHPIFVDVDNNGLLDLFVTHAKQQSQLWLQTSPGKFENKTKQSGITTDYFATCASFFDINNDGLEDLFIGHHGPNPFSPAYLQQIKTSLKLPPNTPDIALKLAAITLAETQGSVSLDGKNGQSNQLYLNMGHGQFKNISKSSKLNSPRWALASTAFDYNQDGLLDLFIANDFGEDELYLNNGDLTFTNIAPSININDRGGGMSATIADVNQDQQIDLYVTVIDMFSKTIGFKQPTHLSTFTITPDLLQTSHYLTGNKFYVSSGNQLLNKESFYYPSPPKGWGWGTTFFDADNDGDLDHYIMNGFYHNTLADRQQNLFFLNDSNSFHMYPTTLGIASNSRAVISADLNNDGYQDIITTQLFAPPQLFKNTSHIPTHHWVGITISPPKSGTAVTITDNLGHTQQQLITYGTNYLSQAPTTLHFGLGHASFLSKITILEPGKPLVTLMGPFEVNRYMSLSLNK